MVQGYYTLEEAAQILGMPPEQLGQMAQRREIRAFADRGTWRFRTQDVQEMARRMGRGSSPELQLGEPKSSVKDPKSSGPKSSTKKGGEIFNFAQNPSDQVEIGQEVIHLDSPSKINPKSSGRNLGDLSPAPKAGSDSDVHLVPDDLNELLMPNDSSVKIDDLNPLSKTSSKRKTGLSGDASKSGVKKKTGLSSTPRLDSGVRLVPLDDAEIPQSPVGNQPPRSASDSDVRIELDSGVVGSKGNEGSDPGTLEIDLDAELRQASEVSKTNKPRTRVKPKTGVGPAESPPRSPFELTAADMEVPGSGSSEENLDSNATDALTPGSDDDLRLDDDEVMLGGELAGDGTGINLHSPDDSGINLEKIGNDEDMNFELSLDAETAQEAAVDNAQGSGENDFELTLDGEERELAPLEAESDPEQDIFETDFDLPATDEESASEAVALDDGDTDLESSDFDLSLNEEGTESQVVALEEGEETDEGASTVARSVGEISEDGADGDEAEDVEDLLADDQTAEEEGEVLVGRAPAVIAAPASWGVVPALLLTPCVIIMFLLALMSYELLHDMWGYKQASKPAGLVMKEVAKMLGAELPPD